MGIISIILLEVNHFSLWRKTCFFHPPPSSLRGTIIIISSTEFTSILPGKIKNNFVYGKQMFFINIWRTQASNRYIYIYVCINIWWLCAFAMCPDIQIIKRSCRTKDGAWLFQPARESFKWKKKEEFLVLVRLFELGFVKRFNWKYYNLNMATVLLLFCTVWHYIHTKLEWLAPRLTFSPRLTLSGCRFKEGMCQ